MFRNLRRKHNLFKRTGRAAMDSAEQSHQVDATNQDEIKAVLVTWLDAVAHADWHEPSAEPAVCATLGFLVAVSDTAIEVATSVGLTDNICNASMIIPRGMIISMDEFEPPQRSLN